MTAITANRSGTTRIRPGMRLLDLLLPADVLVPLPVHRLVTNQGDDDVADGGPGRDVCRAEEVVACER